MRPETKIQRAILIDLPWPSKYLWPNGPQKTSYRVKAAEKAKYRGWARLATLEAITGKIEHDGSAIPLTLHVHAKPRGPLPDKDNCIAACKALFDGVADGLGVNDRHFDEPKVVFSNMRDGRIVLEVGLCPLL